MLRKKSSWTKNNNHIDSNANIELRNITFLLFNNCTTAINIDKNICTYPMVYVAEKAYAV